MSPTETSPNGHDANAEDAMMESHLVETTDEDGNVHLFEKLDEFELDEQRYALLLYHGQQKEGGTLAQAAAQLSDKMAGGHEHVHGEHCNHGHDDDDGDDEELVIMKIAVDADGEEWYEEIETEEEYERAANHVESRYNAGDMPFDIEFEDDDKN